MTPPFQRGRRFISGEFARFLIAGAANTAVAYTVYLMLLGGLGYLVAYSIAYVAGILVSYLLNTYFVFRTAPLVSSFMRFPVVYVGQYLLGAAVLWFFVDLVGVPRQVALAFSIVATIPFTFFASRFVLKGRRA